MSEWWTYRPDDFLLYSARTWHRLIELVHADLWPAQFVAAGAGLALVGLAWRTRRDPPPADDRHRRVAAAWLLAAAWAAVAGFFHLQRHAAIHWAAPGFAVAFFVEAGLLVAAAGSPAGRASSRRRGVATALLVFAIVGYPLLAVASGRPWQQAELFAIAPDPTALATLAWLLLTPPAPGAPRWRRWLARARWSIALAWCAWNATMLGVMGAPEAWVVALCAAVAAFVPAVDRRVRGPRAPGRSA